VPFFYYTLNKTHNFYIYNKTIMTYILKKDYENANVDSVNKPLGQLTQDEIILLREHIRNAFFVKKSVNAKSKK